MTGEQPLDVFFYGLFLDPAVLADFGVQAANWRRARLDDHALAIGRRARLVRRPGESAYGAVMSLTPRDLDRLYDRDGLRDYRPVRVEVVFEGDMRRQVQCYNLANDAGDVDRAYTARLADALERHGFAADYVSKVRHFCGRN